MAGVNKVIIAGHLGNDPEMRIMPNGDSVANISVATSEQWTDKTTGEKKTQTEWHRVIFFRRQAEICGQYLSKGSQVYIEGKLKTRKWQDQNGQDRYVTEIQGDVLQMLGSRGDGQQQAKPQAKQQHSKPDPLSAQAEMQDAGGFDDDIPKRYRNNRFRLNISHLLSDFFINKFKAKKNERRKQRNHCLQGL